MCKVLMSIKPEYVESILSGAKKYEFRKTKCKREVDSILIYSTHPVMKVVAEVKVDNILEGTPREVWQRTRNYAGINKAFYDSYFADRDVAYAFCLGEVKKFKRPKPLSSYHISNAPQSFRYL